MAQRLRGAMSALQLRNCAINLHDKNRAIAQISRCDMSAPQRRKDCGARCLRRSGAIARLKSKTNMFMTLHTHGIYPAVRCMRRSGAKIAARDVCAAAAQLVLKENMLIQIAQSRNYCVARCMRHSGAKITGRDVCATAAQLRY